MRYLAPMESPALTKISPTVWTARSSDAAFVFDIPPGAHGFVGFFLWRGREELQPRLLFDQGAGFNELTAITLKAFPFAFYHVALDKVRDVRRIRLEPGIGPTSFRFLPLRMTNPVTVAVLHYLFNLRYQDIGLIATDSRGGLGALAWTRSNVARTVKFFRDVSAGRGVHVQQGAKDMLPSLRFFLSQQAESAQARMAHELVDRDGPLISFVSPTYNTGRDYLADLLNSFALEDAAYAELILSDDGSTDGETLSRLREASDQTNVSVIFNPQNAGIAAATNAGLRAARGEWVAFIDHDDQFVPGAIAIIGQAIQDNPQADFFYTDEIIGDAALKPIGAFCKPAYDSVLLSGVNYINHFSVFRRAKLAAIDGLRRDRDGSQDYDLLLRYLRNVRPGGVVHIPYLGYLWRRGVGTYSKVFAERAATNARLALHDAYRARGQDVSVGPARDRDLHRITFRNAPQPTVSVIIPNRDSLGLISRIVEDLRKKTTYPSVQIVIVDNGSTHPKVLRYYEDLRREGVVIDIVEEPFNFAAMCNRGARFATGEALLFLNNDIEIIEPDWLAEMVSCLAFDETAIVGAKLLYPSGHIQHAGVIVGLGGAAGHWYIGELGDEAGPMSRLNVRQTMSAVTGACMLVERRCFDAMHGFDADAFAIAYNDIDFCLRARAAGFRTVWTPFAQLVHHESVSRGSDETGVNAERFKLETARLRERHGTESFIDDAYHPFYDWRYSKPTLVVPDNLPRLRPNVFS